MPRAKTIAPVLDNAVTAALQHSAVPETAEIARAIVSATRRKAAA